MTITIKRDQRLLQDGFEVATITTNDKFDVLDETESQYLIEVMDNMEMWVNKSDFNIQ